MKKIIAIMLAIITVFSVLSMVGCNQPEENPENQEISEEEVPEEELEIEPDEKLSKVLNFYRNRRN